MGEKTPDVSAADEIAKYKQLLDDKAITPQEYDMKKAELLDVVKAEQE